MSRGSSGASVRGGGLYARALEPARRRQFGRDRGRRRIEALAALADQRSDALDSGATVEVDPGDGCDPRAERDLLAGEALGPAAVPPLAGMEDPVADRFADARAVGERAPVLVMGVDRGPLLRLELGGGAGEQVGLDV